MVWLPPLFCVLVFVLYVAGHKGYRISKYHNEVDWCIKTGSPATFNKILPDGYKVYTKETSAYNTVFREYISWLLNCYFEQNFSDALSNYHRLLSWKNRKIWHPKKLSQFFGNSVKSELFLLETMDYFLWFCDKEDRIGSSNVYTLGPSPDQDTLTAIGIVVWKLRLSASITRNICGFTNDHEIECAKMLLNKSVSPA